MEQVHDIRESQQARSSDLLRSAERIRRILKPLLSETQLIKAVVKPGYVMDHSFSPPKKKSPRTFKLTGEANTPARRISLKVSPLPNEGAFLPFEDFLKFKPTDNIFLQIGLPGLETHSIKLTAEVKKGRVRTYFGDCTLGSATMSAIIWRLPFNEWVHSFREWAIYIVTSIKD